MDEMRPQRRTRIPDKPVDKTISLWGLIKNFVGKDMTRVSMPVNFNEPLSMLQRLTECFDYSQLLDYAAKKNDEFQLAYVTAFAISSYSSTCDRISKPFNPLLGETYECDRRQDLGWRCISEQVSHHPPITAMHCEGKEWTAWQHIAVSSKFRGKFIRVDPSGVCHLKFRKSENHYTWNKIVTTVHNVIIGNLWVDQTGTMIVTNHKTGWKSVIEFVPFNFYNIKEQRIIKGIIKDNKEIVQFQISGTWDTKLTLVKSNNENNTTEKETEIVLWERRPLAVQAKAFYNFSLLACQLNEPENDVAPTDSRNRPDQRCMENGDWELANIEKNALEEKQRIRKRESRSVKPIWFHLQDDPLSGLKIYIYNEKYWTYKEKKDWSQCPNIYA